MNTKKVFNVTGLCVPHLHYMVDVSEKIELIIDKYIKQDAYFTINRARQYGKTTTLELLYHRLRSEYVILDISFEGKEEYFASLSLLAGGLCFSFRRAMYQEYPNLAEIFADPIDERYPMQDLGERITKLCIQAGKKVILMIDEVDKAADNQTFLAFLGMLRDKYLERQKRRIPTFGSVILVGVHDIKNLKMKLRPEDGHNYNSPWNIAASFDIDMSFSEKEIASMLVQYAQDRDIVVNLLEVSKELYRYTEGYPFLVSCLCRKIDESGWKWDCDGVRCAVREILKENNTLFDDVIKNIKNNSDFAELIEQILVYGAQITYEIRNPLIDLGVMYGILKEKDGKAVVSNVIFETLILNYFISVRSTYELTSSQYTDKVQYIQKGHLNMELVLQRFAAFMKAVFREEDSKFIERQGRLLFLSFLRPIINGTGHYAVEPQTRQNTRMDIQVFYGSDEFIIELKIWHGEKQEKKAYDQLIGYLEARSVKKGYLLSFCSNQTKPYENRRFIYKGYEIYEVIVAYCIK